MSAENAGMLGCGDVFSVVPSHWLSVESVSRDPRQLKSGKVSRPSLISTAGGRMLTHAYADVYRQLTSGKVSSERERAEGKGEERDTFG